LLDSLLQEMVGSLGPLVGALDQGTSSTRFLVFTAETSQLVTFHQVQVGSQSPQRGWVEQDPQELLESSIICINNTVEKLKMLSVDPDDIVSIGVTNQRETVVVWDKMTGASLYPAIVWSDLRTKDMVTSLKMSGRSSMVQERSGLPLATYFSAVKLRWLLNSEATVAAAHDEGRLLAGTVDSWLIWNLTGGAESGLHLTDVTNASRTGLMNIHTQTWDKELASFYGVPLTIMPRIQASGDMFGSLQLTSLAGVAITGCMGDQQAALVGHSCTRPGLTKLTMGTGCFMLTNVGVRPIMSQTGLVSTVAYKLQGGPTYFGLEGSVGCAGAAMDWLHGGLGISKEELRNKEEHYQDMKNNNSIDECGGVMIVPAYAGLLSPRWRPDASGVILGLSLHTKPRHIIRATMEGVGHMVREVWDCMNTDLKRVNIPVPQQVVLSGGLASNDELCKVMASLLDTKLVRPTMLETTALGVAMVAGHTAQVWRLPEMSVVANTFLPSLTMLARQAKLERWEKAVQSSLCWGEDTQARESSVCVEQSLPGTIFLFSTAALVLLGMAARQGE